LRRIFSWLIEVGFKPGVTDNVGATAKRACEDILGTSLNGVYFSRQYLLEGSSQKKMQIRLQEDFSQMVLLNDGK